jgi:hypothetical protein
MAFDPIHLLDTLGRYVLPSRATSSSEARVFGISVYGRRRPRGHPVMVLHRLFLRIHNFKWRMYHRFHPHHRYNFVATGLPPGYYDADTRMLHVCMNLLVGFVEGEHGGEDALARWTDELINSVDSGPVEAQASMQTEALAIYHWWKHERPENHRRYDEMLTRLYSNKRMVTKPVEINGQQMHEFVALEGEDQSLPGDSYDALMELEKANDEADQAMLHRLIDIRSGLWT